jgi:hypothetical protein
MEKNENLKSWSKGHSGNPAGRPVGSVGTKAILERFLALERDTINPVTKEEETLSVGELMALKQIKKALKGDLYAYREILDRLEGKAISVQEIKQEVTQRVINIGFSNEPKTGV